MSVYDFPDLKFANVHIDKILNGEKTVTFRIDLPPEFMVGQWFWVCDAEGEQIVCKRIDERKREPIRKVAKMNVQGHKHYKSVDTLIEAMEKYYPDRDVNPETRLDILRWHP